MANTFAPFGFRPFGDQEGSAPTAGLTRRYLASSDTNLYFTGDVIAQSTSIPGYITLPASGVTLGTTSSPPLLGIFAGCEYYQPSVGRVVWNSFFPGNVGSSSPCNAYIIEDPNQLFTVQATTTSILGTSAIGFGFGFTSSDTTGKQNLGSQLSGISNIALLSSVAVNTSGAAFRLVDTTSNYAPPGTNGADGTTAGAIVVVAFNNQLRRGLTGPST